MLKDKNVVNGGPAPYIPSHLNFGKYMLDRLRLFGDKVAFINGETGEETTFKQIVQQTVNLAIQLERLGLRKGDVVGICSENRYESIISELAVICTGAIVTTINVNYTEDELRSTVNLSKPRYFFCSPYAVERHNLIFKSLIYIEKIIQYGVKPVIPALLFSNLCSHHVDVDAFEPADVQGQTDTMVILYSSGTTGLPKGVMLTHLNVLIAIVSSPYEHFEAAGINTVLSVLPWHHAYGFITNFSFSANGRTMVFLTRFHEEHYLRCISTYKVNHILAVPSLVVFLAKSPLVLKYELSSVTSMQCGAAPLAIELVTAITERFPNLKGIDQGYGLTEVTFAASKEFERGPEEKRFGSNGRPILGGKVKVIDPMTGKSLPPNQQGEICFKSPTLMKGYVNNPKATAESFDDEGYLKTGDAGFVDQDGFLYIVDRLKELIKYKSFQVAPAEIEALLLKHAGVRECGVVGTPDAASGELPTAFVVRQPTGTALSSVTEHELKDFVASKLSRYKHLHGGVIFVSEIPKNNTGKILRRELKELAMKRSKL